MTLSFTASRVSPISTLPSPHPVTSLPQWGLIFAQQQSESVVTVEAGSSFTCSGLKRDCHTVLSFHFLHKHVRCYRLEPWQRHTFISCLSSCCCPLRKCSSGSACSSVMPLLYRPLPISITNLPCRFICLYHHQCLESIVYLLLRAESPWTPKLKCAKDCQAWIFIFKNTPSPLTDMQVVCSWQCFTRITIPSQKSTSPVRVRSETNNTAAKGKIAHVRHTLGLWKNVILSKSTDGTKTSAFG